MRPLLLVLLPGLAGLTVMIVAAAVVVHGVRRRRERRRMRWATSVRRDVLTLVLEDVPTEVLVATEGRLRKLGRNREGRALLTEIVISVAGTVRGDADGRLGHLVVVTGVAGQLDGDLTDPDPGRRAAAAETVGALRLGGSVTALRGAMRDPDVDVRMAAATAYVRLDPGRAVPAVLRMLANEETSAAERLAELVGLAGPVAVPSILEEMEVHGRTPLLLRVLAATGETLAAQPVLIAALASPQAEVRIEAARALSRAATTLACPALLTALGDPEDAVRAHAATALGQLGASQVVPALVALLDDRRWAVRQRAAAAIAAVPGGITVLSDLIGRGPQFVTTAAATGLQQAAIGTGLLADLVATDPLRRTVAEAAVIALARRSEFTALLTEAAARYPNPEVRARLTDLLVAPVDGELPPVPTPRAVEHAG